jgi:hypothetical protein
MPRVQEEVAGDAEVFLWRENGGRGASVVARESNCQVSGFAGTTGPRGSLQRVTNGSTRWAARTNATMTAMPARKKITCSA